MFYSALMLFVGDSIKEHLACKKSAASAAVTGVSWVLTDVLCWVLGLSQSNSCQVSWMCVCLKIEVIQNLSWNNRYYTGFWEMAKWGWVQYVSVLVLFWYIMDRIQRFIFQNQLVSTIILRPYHVKKLWDDFSRRGVRRDSYVKHCVHRVTI